MSAVKMFKSTCIIGVFLVFEINYNYLQMKRKTNEDDFSLC